MKNSSNLIEALKAIREGKKSADTAFREKLNEIRTTDFAAIAKEQNKEIIEQLSEDEKKRLDADVKDVANSYSAVVDSLIEYFDDPEMRTKIKDELKRRLA